MIDALSSPGGAHSDLPVSMGTHSPSDSRGCMKRDLCRALRHPGTTGRATIRLNEQVLELETLPDGLIRLGTTRGTLEPDRDRMRRRRRLRAEAFDVPGAPRARRQRVHYFAKRVEDFRDRQVVIVGGGDLRSTGQ